MDNCNHWNDNHTEYIDWHTEHTSGKVWLTDRAYVEFSVEKDSIDVSVKRDGSSLDKLSVNKFNVPFTMAKDNVDKRDYIEINAPFKHVEITLCGLIALIISNHDDSEYYIELAGYSLDTRDTRLGLLSYFSSTECHHKAANNLVFIDEDGTKSLVNGKFIRGNDGEVYLEIT